MLHFPPHAHVDEMTNAEQQWGVATTSFYDNECLLLDDLLNQIGCHVHDSQLFPKFLTLGSKYNRKPMGVRERLFLQRNYPNMRFSDEIGVMPMRRSSSRRSDKYS